ncbi:hypothetical protein OG948_18905 [Embleya sp. NBC_00888]|nr:hypothetical protein OG948_18905 [Embleya sp. NBC_00888]
MNITPELPISVRKTRTVAPPATLLSESANCSAAPWSIAWPFPLSR